MSGLNRYDPTTGALKVLGNNEAAILADLTAILAKIIAAPATEAKQDTLKTAVDLLATAAKQDTLKTAVDLLATAAKQDTLKTAVDLLATAAKQDTALIALGGGVTVGAIDSVTVGAVSTVVLAAAAGRRSATITNMSGEIVYVAAGTTAVSTKGIPLAAKETGEKVGGSVTFSGADAPLAINGISASGGMNVAVQTTSIA